MTYILTLLTAIAEPTNTDPMANQYQDVSFVIAASENLILKPSSKPATLAEKSGIVFNTNGVKWIPNIKIQTVV